MSNGDDGVRRRFDFGVGYAFDTNVAEAAKDGCLHARRVRAATTKNPSYRQPLALGRRQRHFLTVSMDGRLAEDPVEVERRFSVAADAVVVTDRDVHSSSSLLVEQDRTHEFRDGDVGADAEFVATGMV